MSTVSDVIKEVRFLLSEEVPYRWENPELITYINDGLRSLYGHKPEAFYIDDIVITPPTSLTTVSEVVPIDPFYDKALIHYVVSAVLGQDSEDANNQKLANEHLSKYSLVVD